MIDLTDTSKLSRLSPAQALIALGEISQILAQKPATTMTEDSADGRMLRRLSSTQEAEEFAAAAKRFHRRGIAARDCRPELRVAADERRSLVTDANAERFCPTPDEMAMEQEAADYASTLRQFHRK